jgi:hypothetical protein
MSALDQISFIKGAAAMLVAQQSLNLPVTGKHPWLDAWLSDVTPIVHGVSQQEYMNGIAALAVADDYPFVRVADFRAIKTS